MTKIDESLLARLSAGEDVMVGGEAAQRLAAELRRLQMAHLALRTAVEEETAGDLAQWDRDDLVQAITALRGAVADDTLGESLSHIIDELEVQLKAAHTLLRYLEQHSLILRRSDPKLTALLATWAESLGPQ